IVTPCGRGSAPAARLLPRAKRTQRGFDEMVPGGDREACCSMILRLERARRSADTITRAHGEEDRTGTLVAGVLRYRWPVRATRARWGSLGVREIQPRHDVRRRQADSFWSAGAAVRSGCHAGRTAIAADSGAATIDVLSPPHRRDRRCHQLSRAGERHVEVFS